MDTPLNVLLSDLGLEAVNCDFNREQGGGLTVSGVQPGGQHDQIFSKSCGVVIEQVRDLERVLLRKDDWKAEPEKGGGVLDAAVARGMPRPVSCAPGGAGSKGDSAARYNVLNINSIRSDVSCFINALQVLLSYQDG